MRRTLGGDSRLLWDSLWPGAAHLCDWVTSVSSWPPTNQGPAVQPWVSRFTSLGLKHGDGKSFCTGTPWPRG